MNLISLLEKSVEGIRTEILFVSAVGASNLHLTIATTAATMAAMAETEEMIVLIQNLLDSVRSLDAGVSTS